MPASQPAPLFGFFNLCADQACQTSDSNGIPPLDDARLLKIPVAPAYNHFNGLIDIGGPLGCPTEWLDLCGQFEPLSIETSTLPAFCALDETAHDTVDMYRCDFVSASAAACNVTSGLPEMGADSVASSPRVPPLPSPPAAPLLAVSGLRELGPNIFDSWVPS